MANLELSADRCRQTWKDRGPDPCSESLSRLTKIWPTLAIFRPNATLDSLKPVLSCPPTGADLKNHEAKVDDSSAFWGIRTQELTTVLRS